MGILSFTKYLNYTLCSLKLCVNAFPSCRWPRCRSNVFPLSMDMVGRHANEVIKLGSVVDLYDCWPPNNLMVICINFSNLTYYAEKSANYSIWKAFPAGRKCAYNNLRSAAVRSELLDFFCQSPSFMPTYNDCLFSKLAYIGNCCP